MGVRASRLPGHRPQGLRAICRAREELHMTSRYSGERVRRGLWHFLLGKGVSALCSFLAMVLVVRALTLHDFADYTVLVALVELGTAFSGLGLSHVLLRYVPELYERQYRLSLRQLIGGALGMRTTAVLLLALL